MGGLAWKYHLRSNSGSNGPVAKDCHRFLVAGPFKYSGFLKESFLLRPSRALFSPPTPALPPPTRPAHLYTYENKSSHGLPAEPVFFLLSAGRANEFCSTHLPAAVDRRGLAGWLFRYFLRRKHE